MTPEQARFFLTTFLPVIEEEHRATAKVINSIPQEHCDWKPDEKARSASELAGHIVSSEVWFLDGIASGEFGDSSDKAELAGKSCAELASWYSAAYEKELERVKALSDADLVRDVSFFGMESHSAVYYLTYLLLHTAHHRGQLAAYLRPMGGKVPSIYGGSADEPFTGEAAAG
ncbi:MAG: DinB family protein [Acidobacteria bacterium]|nr:DinB family protein [Acidobacteriota bacterium]